MYCPSCGAPMSQQVKYCNRCGTQLINANEVKAIAPAEKRLDEYLDGLFWITVFGLGLILGGMTLMKFLHFGERLIVVYLILSSSAFLTNFGLSLWGVYRLTKSAKILKDPPAIAQIAEPGSLKTQTLLESAVSVTENTTRGLEPVSRNRITK